MTKEHLKNISERPDFKEITSRGGKGKPDTNRKKSRSARLRWMKEKHPELVEIMDWIGSDDPKKAMDWLFAEILDQRQLIEQVKWLEPRIKLKDLFLRRVCDFIKFKYGTYNERLQKKRGLEAKEKSVITGVKVEEKVTIVKQGLETKEEYERKAKGIKLEKEKIEEVENEKPEEIVEFN